MLRSDRNGFYSNRRRVIQFGILIGCALLLAISLVQSPVSAASSYLFHPGFGTAVIDGHIEASEWVEADSYSLVLTASSMTGTLYVMQSATDLYLGFVVDDDEFTIGYLYGLHGDTVEIAFDDNNSGSLYEVDENKVTIMPVTPWVYDAHFYNTTGSSEADTDQTGGETNGEAMAARHGDDNHFELRFPLCSGDSYDFCLTPGDILGLQIQYDDMVNYGGLSYTGHRYPGVNNDSLVTIEISAFLTYLPLIRK